MAQTGDDVLRPDLALRPVPRWYTIGMMLVARSIREMENPSAAPMPAPLPAPARPPVRVPAVYRLPTRSRHLRVQIIRDENDPGEKKGRT